MESSNYSCTTIACDYTFSIRNNSSSMQQVSVRVTALKRINKSTPSFVKNNIYKIYLKPHELAIINKNIYTGFYPNVFNISINLVENAKANNK